MHKLITILIGSFLLQQVVIAAPLTNDSFAYSATLSDANTSLRQFDLPVTLYHKIKRKDYGDLRIFNADGQIVPHQFSQAKKQDSIQKKSLVFFPFSKQQANHPDNIQVVINQKKNQRHNQQNITINQSIASDNANKSNQYQYIIENSATTTALCKLKLEWTQPKSSMVIGLKLESSATLKNWKTLSRKLNISKLDYAGSKLINNEISFPCTTQKYLRLTWLKSNQHIQLNHILGIYSKNAQQAIQTASLGKPVYDNVYESHGSWLFEKNSIASISQMEMIAPQDGLLYKGALYSRDNNKAEWRFRQQIKQFKLNLGDSKLQSSPIEMIANNDRYWKLDLANEGRFSQDQFPEIRVSWTAKQVIFMAQGKSPFELAFGNPSIKPAHNNDLNSLIQSLKQTDSNIDKVKLEQITNSGIDFKTKTHFPWKKIILWLVLIIGTLLMAFMAFRLYQQINEEQ